MLPLKISRKRTLEKEFRRRRIKYNEKEHCIFVVFIAVSGIEIHRHAPYRNCVTQ